MSTSNIEYLRRLIAESKFEQGVDAGELRFILETPEAEEGAGSPERFLARFAGERAKTRLKSAREKGKRTKGSEQLIDAIERIDKNKKIDCYNIENNTFIGSCFVIDKKIVGYEFVEKKGTSSFPGLRMNLLN
ncbi:MAG: hypothetical protein JJU08_10675 [Rhodobacteraceae bacterium]|nr:hypothetical protein [Paracoccaceae bacterium]